jgi:Family of unknown function (DUF5317)
VTIFVGLAFAVVLVVALGGRLGNLTSVELRGKPAVIGAFLMQLLVVTVAPHAFSHAVASAIHLASYALAIVFVYANRHLPNLWIAALGGVSNFVAITANGGTMPASKTALAAAGLPVLQNGFDNSGAVAHARLAFLGDIFSFPKGLPLANVFSLGDVLLLIGAAAMLAGICGCPRVPALDGLLRRPRASDARCETPGAASEGTGRAVKPRAESERARP